MRKGEKWANVLSVTEITRAAMRQISADISYNCIKVKIFIWTALVWGKFRIFLNPHFCLQTAMQVGKWIEGNAVGGRKREGFVLVTGLTRATRATTRLTWAPTRAPTNCGHPQGRQGHPQVDKGIHKVGDQSKILANEQQLQFFIFYVWGEGVTILNIEFWILSHAQTQYVPFKA